MSETTTTTDQGQDDGATLDNESWRTKRLNASEEKRKAAEKRAAELEERLEALEHRDKTDVERLTRELEKVQKRFADAEQRAADLEAAREKDAKMGLVAAAAAKAKFQDPSLAGLIVNLDEIDDAKSAEAAVKQVAKDRPYLIQQEDPTRARLQRVGVDGRTVEDEGREKGLITEEEQKAEWGRQMLAGLEGQARDQVL